MLLDQVTPAQMQAGGVLSGLTMAAFIAAPLLRRHVQLVRIGIAAVYIAGIVGFAIYSLF
jgi:hypothetical protein